MSDATATEAITSETSEATEKVTKTPFPETPPASKKEIYNRVADRLNAAVQERWTALQKRIKDKTGQDFNFRDVFGEAEGREVVIEVLGNFCSLLTKADAEGNLVRNTTVGLPGGFGSLELLTAGATTKTTPQNRKVEVPERWRVKWNPGKTMDDLLSKLPAPTPKDPEAPATPESPPAPEAAAPPEAPATPVA